MTNTEDMPVFNGWSIKDGRELGAAFLGECVYADDYDLTVGKTYKVWVIPAIFESRPLCTVIDDNGYWRECHLHRFLKVERIG